MRTSLMAKITAEDAAGRIAALRRHYGKCYRRVAKGDGSAALGREIREAREGLNKVLANLDCPPRPIWTKLLAHFHSLEEAWEEAALKRKSKARPAS
jgi:hypothetical protein